MVPFRDYKPNTSRKQVKLKTIMRKIDDSKERSASQEEPDSKVKVKNLKSALNNSNKMSSKELSFGSTAGFIKEALMLVKQKHEDQNQ